MSFLRRDLSQFAAKFIKIYQEIKKWYAFEVSIISFIETAIFVFMTS